MHRYERSGVRTSPSCALELDKRIYADSVQLSQVLNYAHPVLRAVALVQLPKARARIPGAATTELLPNSGQDARTA